MTEFISQNIGTIIVALIVAVIVVLIAAKLISDKKKGKGGCSCGCGGCPNSELCHGNKPNSAE